jgi:phage terminase large subunit-like protein
MKSRKAREQLLKLLQAKAQRQRTFPLKYISPERPKRHEKQLRFLKSLARVRLFLGSNQSGKTLAGWLEGFSHAYGYRVWEVPDLELVPDGRGGFDLPPRSQIPEKYWIKNSAGHYLQVPNLGMIITGLPARRGLGDCIWPKFQELWPPGCRCNVRWHQGGVPASIEFPNGSRVILGSAEQQELSTEAVVLHWAWFDEPVPQRIYSGAWRGLIRNFGRVWFTLTPLGAKAAWLYNDFISPAQRGELDEGRVEFIQVTMWDNPYLDPQAVEEFANDPSFSESEKAARLYGKFEHLTSRVLPQFYNSAPYVIPYQKVPSSWPIVHVVDPHTARPWAMIWAARDPLGRFHIFREWPEHEFTKIKSSDVTFREYANIIRDLEGKDIAEWRVIDPNYGVQRRQNMGFQAKSIQEEMSELGIYFDARVDDKSERTIGRIQDMLKFDKNRAVGPQRPVPAHGAHLGGVQGLLRYGQVHGQLRLPDPRRRRGYLGRSWIIG